MAADDFCYLLSRDYGSNAALHVVGNRYRLNARQQMALYRIGVGESRIANRKSKCISKADIFSKPVSIDGFNLLILLESALSGGYIFRSRDGLLRDMSSVHGTYKRVAQTGDAIRLTGKFLKELQASSITWYLDKPVSNSGRLKTLLMEIAEELNIDWNVELVFSPDKVLAESKSIVVSSDGWIIDNCESWINLGSDIIEDHIPNALIIEV